MNLDFIIITISTTVCGEDMMVAKRKGARLVDDTLVNYKPTGLISRRVK